MMDVAGLKRAYEQAQERDEGSGEQEQETRARLLPAPSSPVPVFEPAKPLPKPDVSAH